jgi:hypothetical protein
VAQIGGRVHAAESIELVMADAHACAVHVAHDGLAW